MTEPVQQHVHILRPMITPAHLNREQREAMADRVLSFYGRGTIPPPQPLFSRMLPCPLPTTWSQ